MPLAVYLHIPFCLSKCRYCAFNSVPLPGGSAGKALIAGYLAAMKREMAYYAGLCGEWPVGTIYGGGGTPTVLDAALLTDLLNACHRLFQILPNAEVTTEANPGTINQEQLTALRRAGFNRISLGAQSFNETQLHMLGRVHSAAEINTGFLAARGAGFDNINLDLINCLPGQTLEDWQQTLTKALVLHPEHISVYGLTIEEGTPLAAAVEAGQLALPDEELQVSLWELTESALSGAGYRRYEISSYALPGRECRHNLVYWHNREYVGIGAGAYGRIGSTRYANLPDPRSYIEAAEEGRLPRAVKEEQTRQQEISETVIMELRLADGVSLAAFQERFGISFTERYAGQLAWLADANLVEIGQRAVRLSPRGKLLANRVLAYFV